MNLTAIITGVVGSICTLLLGIISKRFDFRGEQNKAALEESKTAPDIVHKTNDEWERLYQTQIKANERLQDSYDALKRDMDKRMEEMQQQVNRLNSQIAKLNSGFEEKERGYQLQIEALENENDELREENETMKIEIHKLRGGE